MTKICARCKKRKNLKHFGTRMRRGRAEFQAYCIPCNKAYQRQHYIDNESIYTEKSVKYRKDLKRWIEEEFKSDPCVDCGNDFPPFVMDFHHRDRATKILSISEMVNKGLSADKIIDEIAKCDLVCANCHRIREHSAKYLARSSNG